MDMTPGSKHNDEHDEAQEKVFHGYGFRPGGKNKKHVLAKICYQDVTRSCQKTCQTYNGDVASH